MKGDQLLQRLGSKSRVFFNRHSGTILTCVGAVGVVTTAVMAVQATPKALRLIEEAKEEKGEELTNIEVVKTAGPVYIPSLLLGVSTLACIFGANSINKQKQATIASAYALLDRSYKEYKAKVAELYGEDANRNVITEVAKDRYEEEDLSDLYFEDGKKLFYDEYSHQYFEAYPEHVIKAEYDLNRKLFTTGGASLNDFYQSLIKNGVDIDLYPGGDELGWSPGILESHYWSTWIEFDHYETAMEDGMECTIIAMRCAPVIDYAYY